MGGLTVKSSENENGNQGSNAGWELLYSLYMNFVGNKT